VLGVPHNRRHHACCEQGHIMALRIGDTAPDFVIVVTGPARAIESAASAPAPERFRRSFSIAACAATRDACRKIDAAFG